MKIIFKLALSFWVAFMLSGCERPPIETVQTGYRGTGMEQIYNPRTLIQTSFFESSACCARCCVC